MYDLDIINAEIELQQKEEMLSHVPFMRNSTISQYYKLTNRKYEQVAKLAHLSLMYDNVR